MHLTLPHRHVARLFAVLTATVVALVTLAVPVGATPQSDPTGDLGTVAEQIGALALREQGLTGAGVQVAVIDTGVAPVPALGGEGKVVGAVDLSVEAATGTRFVDTNGHGTHMAGIVAGHDEATGFSGIAPGAGILALKVAGHDGSCDESQVVAALDWLVDHHDDDGLDVRVVNLSLGAEVRSDRDPLALAVERAWDAGIVVVASTGNDGRPEKGLANPARDPYVIAVGAADLRGGKIRAAYFSTSGDGVRNPDVIAPGVSIESLRAPGSTIEVEHPEGRIDDERFKGSGSSQAAAVVSGAVALLLEARPDLTPDQVKALLTSTARRAKSNERFGGHGLIDLSAAAAAPTPGSGTVQLLPAQAPPSTPAYLAWTGASWTGASWTGASWTGASWTGASWTGASWTGASWTGASWTGASWTGASWS
jgi:serine protease AprX